jgi:hypothetical protein
MKTSISIIRATVYEAEVSANARAQGDMIEIMLDIHENNGSHRVQLRIHA